ncbi:hypothetical protein ACHWQZ_G017853 [Mnemiopsis leidyi]
MSKRFYLPNDEEANNLSQGLLSESTKRKTEGDIKIVRAFMRAKSDNLRENGQEPDFWDTPLIELTPEQLAQVVTHFAIGARTEKNETYEPTSLQTFWYSIKRYFRGTNMDFNNPIFNGVVDTFKSTFKKLKSEGGGQKPNAAHALTVEEISFLFDSKCAGPHHPRALTNAMLIFLMMMGRRGMSELHKLRYGDVQVVQSNGQVFVEIKDVHAKNRQGENPQEGLHRSGALCAIKDSNKCPVTLLTLYHEKRPESMRTPDSPFFLSCNTKADKDYRRSFNGATWYFSTKIGINTLSKIVKNMVQLSGLPVEGRNITNTSIRKCLASTLLEAGMSSKATMAYTRHKSASSLVHYDNINPKKATQATNILLKSDASYTLQDPSPILFSSLVPNIKESPSTSGFPTPQTSEKKRPLPSARINLKRGPDEHTAAVPKNKNPVKRPKFKNVPIRIVGSDPDPPASKVGPGSPSAAGLSRPGPLRVRNNAPSVVKSPRPGPSRTPDVESCSKGMGNLSPQGYVPANEHPAELDIHDDFSPPRTAAVVPSPKLTPSPTQRAADSSRNSPVTPILSPARPHISTPTLSQTLPVHHPRVYGSQQYKNAGWNFYGPVTIIYKQQNSSRQ